MSRAEQCTSTKNKYSNLSFGHIEGLWTALRPGSGPTKWCELRLRLGPYHSVGPSPGSPAVHKISQCPQFRFICLKRVIALILVNIARRWDIKGPSQTHSFFIPTQENAQQYQCTNPILFYFKLNHYVNIPILFSYDYLVAKIHQMKHDALA